VTTPPPAAPRSPEHVERYSALRTIAAIIRILAYIVAIVGGIAVVVGAISAFAGGVPGQGLLVLVGGLLYVAVIALFLFAYAEIIRLIIAVEDNTRLTAEALAGRGGQLP
jgi:cytochrome b subunit of formate dehydrogenase